jgi:hypothetical protein
MRGMAAAVRSHCHGFHQRPPVIGERRHQLQPELPGLHHHVKKRLPSSASVDDHARDIPRHSLRRQNSRTPTTATVIAGARSTRWTEEPARPRKHPTRDFFGACECGGHQSRAAELLGISRLHARDPAFGIRHCAAQETAARLTLLPSDPRAAHGDVTATEVCRFETVSDSCSTVSFSEISED